MIVLMPRSLQPRGESKLMAPKRDFRQDAGPCKCSLQLSKWSLPKGGGQENKLLPPLQSAAHSDCNRPVCQLLHEGKTPHNNSIYRVSKLPKRFSLTTVLPAKRDTFQIPSFKKEQNPPNHTTQNQNNNEKTPQPPNHTPSPPQEKKPNTKRI